MSINLLTSRQAVLDAIGEWDTLGRDRFLERYGYGPAKSFFVQHDGKLYDSKALIGVAVGKQFPDRGPLRNNEFSGGEGVKQKLQSLGFEFLSEVKLTSADIALLKQSRTKDRYANLTEDERNAYIRITTALREVGHATLAILGDEYELIQTAGFHLGSGVRGAVPKDLWFGIFAKENAEKFVGSPQIFMIVSGRGVEFGFAPSTHPSGFSNSAVKARVRAAAPKIFDLMPAAGSAEALNISAALDAAGGWHFQRQTRLPANEDDFASLSDWLSYLHSPSGKADAGGSISKYLGPQDLEQHDLILEAIEAAEIFKPLMKHVRAGTSMPSQPTADSDSFATLLTDFLEKFSAARSQPYGVVDTLWSAASHLRQWLQDIPPVKERTFLTVNWSAGKGVWARVPWIAILNRNITTTTQQGLYCVFLISQDLSSVYLTLAQGVTELNNELRPARANEVLNERAAAFRAAIPELANAGFTLANDVDLKCDGRLARGYEQSVIAYVKFDADELPTDDELQSYLEPLLVAYDKLAQSAESTAEPILELDTPVNAQSESEAPPWTIDDAMAELFLSRAEFERILSIWAPKKNLVLQGAPGVGKTFLAKRLAYTLIGSKDPSRVESVQFHQSYGYEDFVQGYRPDGFGGFVLKNGIFYDFCEKARSDTTKRYVFVIDEINRGNLSKIFGELMLLIEPDKRSADWAARLAYGGPDAPRFYVPENLYVIGMMNTADRSLSLVDYALRRRFSFATLEPQFDSAEFRKKLESLDVSSVVVDLISQRMSNLNELISTDTVNLGRGFRIGHSFFVPTNPVTDSVAWYRQIIETEIRPLLDEYWLDDLDKVESLCAALLDGLP
jgi:hypothetical protein